MRRRSFLVLKIIFLAWVSMIATLVACLAWAAASGVALPTFGALVYLAMPGTRRGRLNGPAGNHISAGAKGK